MNKCIILPCSCFLSNLEAFLLAFLLPVLLAILCNSIVFVVVIGIMVKHTKGTLTRKNESIKTKTIFLFLTRSMGVMFLFGISWLFAALTFTTVQGIRLPAQVIFVIFNSLQGFFIFIFFCVLNRDARESWKQVLSFGWYKSAYLNPSLKRAKKSKASQAGSNGKSKREPSTSSYVIRGTSSTALTVEKSESSNLYSEPDTTAREKVDLAKAPENKGNVRLNVGITHNSAIAEYSSTDEHGSETPAAENNATDTHTALVHSPENNDEDDHHMYAHLEPTTTTTDSFVTQNEQAIIELHLQNDDFLGSDEPSEVKKETALS